MPTAANAILYFEADQTPVGMTELTDQGDHKDFRSSSNLWSGKAGRAPVVRPNGVKSGGVIIPAAAGSNNLIDISLCVCFLAGIETSVNASAGVTVNRPTVSNFQKHSVTITAAGAFAVVEGEEGSSFSDTRGAAGGPPFIDNDAIEIGQVWYNSQTAAPVASDEIYQVVGSSLERFDSPMWDEKYINVANNVLGNAGIQFVSELPLIHSEDAGTNKYSKDVYASWYVPVFSEAVDAYDFVPPAQSYNINSTPVYGRVKSSVSPTVNQGSFSQELQDGITDNILQAIGYLTWFKFKPERLNDPYILTQGYLGEGPKFPSGANIDNSFTIAPQAVGERIFS